MARNQIFPRKKTPHQGLQQPQKDGHAFDSVSETTDEKFLRLSQYPDECDHVFQFLYPAAVQYCGDEAQAAVLVAHAWYECDKADVKPDKRHMALAIRNLLVDYRKRTEFGLGPGLIRSRKQVQAAANSFTPFSKRLRKLAAGERELFALIYFEGTDLASLSHHMGCEEEKLMLTMQYIMEKIFVESEGSSEMSDGALGWKKALGLRVINWKQKAHVQTAAELIAKMEVMEDFRAQPKGSVNREIWSELIEKLPEFRHLKALDKAPSIHLPRTIVQSYRPEDQPASSKSGILLKLSLALAVAGGAAIWLLAGR